MVKQTRNKTKRIETGNIQFRPEKEDLKALKGIKKRYGFVENSATIRFVLRRFYDNLSHNNSINIITKGE